MNFKFFIKVFFILIITLAIGETALKKLGYPVLYSALFEYDKEIGLINPKSKTIKFLVGQSAYEVTFDSNGILDEFEGKVENIILGDGLVAGMELPKTSRLAYMIGKYSQQGTLNLSVTGHGIYQQALLLERYIESNRVIPKNVVVVFNYESDLFDHIAEFNSPLKPGISYLFSSNKFLKPEIPNFLYSNLSSIWRSSSLVQFIMQKFFKSKKIKKILPDATVYILKNPDSEIAKASIISVDESFKKIKKLSKKYEFNVYIIEWIPPDFEKLVTCDEIIKMRLKLKEVFCSDFFLKPCEYCVGNKPGDLIFIKNSHHLNAHATKNLAYQISNELRSNKIN